MELAVALSGITENCVYRLNFNLLRVKNNVIAYGRTPKKK